jgi:long-chain acyl-CoA synthetase
MYPGSYVASQPDKAAIVMASSGERISFRELDDRSARLAQLLYARGLRPGDHISILAENRPLVFEVYWAAVRSGLYITAINRYLTSEEVAYLVNDSGTVAFVTTEAMSKTAAGLVDLIPRCRLRFMTETAADGYESLEDAVSAYPATRLADQPRGEAMLYSSGTTGRPKGVQRPLSGTQIDDESYPGLETAISNILGLRDDSIYLCPAPLYHAAGLLYSAGVQGSGNTVVVLEKFDAEGFLSIIERERVTHVQVVPTMMSRLIKLPDEVRSKYDLSSLQMLLHSAAPCPIELKRQMIDWLGPIVTEYFGATEGNGRCSITSEEWLKHPGSVGRPMTGVIHICDDEGNELPSPQVGTIYFEGGMQFEYHNDAGKTRSTQHPDHPSWTALGDIGYVDDEGYLYLTDRKAFMIIAGGVNIYPAEIEGCLTMHPKVADVAVFGLPDPDMGEYIHAEVQPELGVEASQALVDELIAFAQANLARFKVPRAFGFRSELPRLPTGKLYKEKLRAEYLQAIQSESVGS